MRTEPFVLRSFGYAQDRIAYCVICLCALALLLGQVSPIRAQDDDFTSTAEYAFGQKISFRLTAVLDEPVASITLFFHTPEFPNSRSVVVDAGLEGDTLVAGHEVDLTQVRLAPFTAVTYWWDLTTITGESVRVPEETFYYEDDRFDWRELQTDDVTVYWTGNDTGLGQLTQEIVQGGLVRLETFVPVTAAPVTVYVYPSSGDLRSALRLAGRDWVGAHTDPALGVILVTAVNSRTAATDLRQSIPHELTHFVLYNALGQQQANLPRWLEEGLATLLEASPNPNYAPLLATAVDQQTTLPLAQLCRQFPAAEQEAVLAYAQSASLVVYLQNNYGNEAVRNLLAAYADGADCEAGVQRVLDRSLAELEVEWLHSQQPQPPLVRFLSQNGLVLLLLLGSFGLMGLLTLGPGKTKT